MVRKEVNGFFNEQTDVGKHRIAMARYLLSYKKATYFELAREVYADGNSATARRWRRAVQNQVKRFVEKGMAKVEEKNGKKIVYLTGEGISYCINNGVFPLGARGRVLETLYEAACPPLIEHQKRVILDLLTDPVLMTIHDGLTECVMRLSYPTEKERSKVSNKVWQILQKDAHSLLLTIELYRIEKVGNPFKRAVTSLRKFLPNAEGALDREVIQNLKHLAHSITGERCPARNPILLPLVNEKGLEREFDALLEWMRSTIHSFPIFELYRKLLLFLGIDWEQYFHYYFAMMKKVLLHLWDLKGK
jgi:hypothetical protein